MIGETSRQTDKDEGWKKIWDLNVEGKIKQFLWKAGQEILPTRQNLYNKRIINNNMCPICEREVESIVHTVWSYPTASDVWAENGSPVQKWLCYEYGFIDLWRKINEKLNVEDVEIVAYTMRRIWLRRNYLIFEENFEHPRLVLLNAKQCLMDYATAQQYLQGGEQERCMERSIELCKEPTGNIYRTNWDTTVDNVAKTSRIGVVIKDNNGDLLAILCSNIKYILKPVVAEVMALRRAMDLCIELGISEVILEGNS